MEPIALDPVDSLTVTTLVDDVTDVPPVDLGTRFELTGAGA
jgi:hypothetical protein